MSYRDCICEPCTDPAYGHPSFAHCAACCMGTMIAYYDHFCPVPEHRELAVRQSGKLEDSLDIGPLIPEYQAKRVRKAFPNWTDEQVDRYVDAFLSYMEAVAEYDPTVVVKT